MKTERLLAAELIATTLINKTALDIPKQSTPFIKQLCFGVMRAYPRLELTLKHLAPRTIKSPMVKAILLVGIYELWHLKTPAYAAISEQVKCSKYRYKWASGLINALLRRASNEKNSIEQALSHLEQWQYNHPQWLIDCFKQDYPEQWQSILRENDIKPNIHLRVNRRKISRSQYQQLLDDQDIQYTLGDSQDCLILKKACNVEHITGFSQGLVSIQDQSAQRAAHIIARLGIRRILDCCAAPGGKSAHMLEIIPDAEIVVVDKSAPRQQLTEENFNRLGLSAVVEVADIKQYHNQDFDAILVDAPCSGTGVIRRHPDIKFTRNMQQICSAAKQQLEILEAIEKLVKPGGFILYATCSIMPIENKKVVAQFMKITPQFKQIDLTLDDYGCDRGQFLPSQEGGDGFFYALMRKDCK